MVPGLLQRLGIPGAAVGLIHNGEVARSRGWEAQIAALPERGAGIVILTNSDLGDDLTADVICLWSRWATGEVPLICQVVPKERNYALAVAGLLAVGLVACAGRVGVEIISGRRRLWILSCGGCSRTQTRYRSCWRSGENRCPDC